MRRSVVAALAAMLLVPLFGGGAAVAARPVAPQISAVTAEWALRTWDDGSVWCTLMSDATLDPGFTKGQPVYAAATVHFQFVGDGTWQQWTYSYERLSRGATTVHAYAGLGSSESPAVADWVRYDLMSSSGTVLSSKQISTENTCPTG